jgi:hypothetical protein
METFLNQFNFLIYSNNVDFVIKSISDIELIKTYLQKNYKIIELKPHISRILEYNKTYHRALKKIDNCFYISNFQIWKKHSVAFIQNWKYDICEIKNNKLFRIKNIYDVFSPIEDVISHYITDNDLIFNPKDIITACKNRVSAKITKITNITDGYYLEINVIFL